MDATEREARRLALTAELAALDEPDDDGESPESSEVAEAAADVAGAAGDIAQAAAAVASSASSTPDPLDVAAARTIEIEAETDAQVRLMREQTRRDLELIAAERGADVAVIEAAAEAMPDEPEPEPEPEPVTHTDTDPAPSGRRFLRGWFG